MLICISIAGCESNYQSGSSPGRIQYWVNADTCIKQHTIFVYPPPAAAYIEIKGNQPYWDYYDQPFVFSRIKSKEVKGDTTITRYNIIPAYD